MQPGLLLSLIIDRIYNFHIKYKKNYILTKEVIRQTYFIGKQNRISNLRGVSVKEGIPELD